MLVCNHCLEMMNCAILVCSFSHHVSRVSLPSVTCICAGVNVKALLSLLLRNAFCTLGFCWSSMKRSVLSRWIKLCTCFESFVSHYQKWHQQSLLFSHTALSFALSEGGCNLRSKFWASTKLQQQEERVLLAADPLWKGELDWGTLNVILLGRFE